MTNRYLKLETLPKWMIIATQFLCIRKSDNKLVGMIQIRHYFNEYLEKYVEKTRNGYMHKDNLYEWTDIQNIRTKTYAAYFMVLGTFFIDVEKLSHIND